MSKIQLTQLAVPQAEVQRPQIITDNYNPTELMREVATPTVS